MNKARDADPDIAPEYDFAAGRRGAYLDRAKRGIRVIAPLVAPVAKPAEASIRDRPIVEPPKPSGA
jgi:hypothetical protein